MTICVAGICRDKNGRENVVMASDRMLTEAQDLRVEFETNQAKKLQIEDNCMALISGSALARTEIEEKISGHTFSGPVSEAADELKEQINKIHKDKVEDRYLKPAGLSMNDFQQLANTGLGGALYNNLISEDTLNAYLLLGGVDDSGGHIYLIADPSRKACFDDIGLHAIGTGEGHARSSLIFNEFGARDVSLFEGIFLIYEAKKKAEMAPGVGEKTDLWVISRNNTVRVPNDSLSLFNDLKKDREEADEETLKEIIKKVEDETSDICKELREQTNEEE